MKTERVVGRIPVFECLRAGKRAPHKLFLLRGGRGLADLEKAAAGLPVEYISRSELDSMANHTVHQGVVLEADPLPVSDVSGWLSGTVDPGAILVILDGVEDPHNFGAIVRSAAAWGAKAVLFAKDRSAPISPASVKSAAGGMEHVELVRATNLSRALATLQEEGFWIAALEPDAKQTIWDADLKGRIGFVIGSEGKGIRPLVSRNCDMHLSIPTQGPMSHLNASVSAAIALAECARQRQSGSHIL